MNILITKKLTNQQKNWLSTHYSDFRITEEAVINSYSQSYQHFVNNSVDKLKTCSQWIFTSRNAVKAVASYQLDFPEKVYAVGQKTGRSIRGIILQSIDSKDRTCIRTGSIHHSGKHSKGKDGLFLW